MKIEKLKAVFCVQMVEDGGMCGELADYRITSEEVSLTLCQDHAQKYLNGKTAMVARTCDYCRSALAPGYYVDSSGRPFCNERHRASWDGSVTTLYR